MGQFVFFAALLGCIAVAFAVSALWQHSRRLALVIALGVPLLAAGLYYLKGEPAALEPANLAAPKTIEQAVDLLEKRVAAEPDSFEGHALLARSYMAVGRYADAARHYGLALELKSDDSDLAVEYAEAQLRISPDRRFPQAAVALLETAVEKNPSNQRALFFLGLQRMQSGRPAEAATLWRSLQPLLGADAAAALQPQIDAALEASGQKATQTATAPGLDIEVRIAPSLADGVVPGAILYVFAVAPEGRGPPSAVKRIVVDRFPLKVRLTDADSPMPAARMSAQARVVVMARLSRSGAANPGPGDIESAGIVVDPRAPTATTLTLEKLLP